MARIALGFDRHIKPSRSRANAKHGAYSRIIAEKNCPSPPPAEIATRLADIAGALAVGKIPGVDLVSQGRACHCAHSHRGEVFRWADVLPEELTEGVRASGS